MNRYLAAAALSLALVSAQAQQIVGSWQFDGNFNWFINPQRGMGI